MIVSVRRCLQGHSLVTQSLPILMSIKRVNGVEVRRIIISGRQGVCGQHPQLKGCRILSVYRQWWSRVDKLATHLNGGIPGDGEPFPKFRPRFRLSLVRQFSEHPPPIGHR